MNKINMDAFQLLNGEKFNELFKGHFIKLTNSDEIHHKYQFKTGLNIDDIPFYPNGSCHPGGIYFCDENDLILWLYYSEIIGPMFYFRSVIIPDNAQVWVEHNKFKADQLILGERLEIGELKIWQNTEHNLYACKLNGMALKYIKNQTPEMCLIAVQQNGNALQYVLEQTREINLMACQSQGLSLRYVRDQTPEINLMAVQQTGYALQYVLEQNPEICLKACQTHGSALQWVVNQSPEIILAAIKQNSYARRLVKN